MGDTTTSISVLDGMTPTEGAIHTLCTNKEASMVAVVGARVLKLYSIEDGEFKEQHNLHQKQKRLNYGACDVAWNQFDENILATAPTNGAVVIWNLGMQGKNKLNYIYSCHECVVNTVCFSHFDPYSLISCSNDGTCKLFDIRVQDSAQLTFRYEDTGSKIRDVQFSPSVPGNFASADENGMLLIWDQRNHYRPAYKTKAHTQPIYSIDYHPSSQNMLATGSRDKSIRVWDYKKEREKACYSLETSAPVWRIRWRPGKQWHLASCSLLSDSSIHVWDISRPYIPFASFESHKDQPAGICWRGEKSPHLLLSVGKDGVLRQHVFKDANRPAEFATPVALDIAYNGEITLASGLDHSKQAHFPFPVASIGTKHRLNDKDDSLFRAHTTSQLRKIRVFPGHESGLSNDWFIRAAKEYIINGTSISQMCEHNAKVAAKYSMDQISETWLIIQTLFDLDVSCCSEPVVHKNSTCTEVVCDTSRVKVDETINTNANYSTDVIDEDTDSARAPTLFGAASTDFFFGSAELIRDGNMDGIIMEPMESEWLLDKEAFEPKPQLSVSEESPNDVSAFTLAETQPPDVIINSPSVLSVSRDHMKQPPWQYTHLVSKVLKFYVDQGDIQTAVCILVVLGEKGIALIDQRLQETWYNCYIELLERFQLWSESALVVKCSPLTRVTQLSNTSTTLNVGCATCNKCVLRKSSYCQVCKKLASICSICRDPVHGLWSWCQGCGHGGHLGHLTTWFKTSKMCPTGCGHECFPLNM